MSGYTGLGEQAGVRGDLRGWAERSVGAEGVSKWCRPCRPCKDVALLS